MHSTKKIQISLVIFALVTITCEPIFYARINNKTTTDIILQLQFDKSEIQSVWQDRPFIPYLHGRLKGGGELLSFDTISLISNILIKPDEYFTIEHSIGFHPTFFGIKKVLIFKNDTVSLDNKESMIKAFLETHKRQFNFDIK